MPSEFDEFMGDCLAESLTVTGTVAFTVGNSPFSGDLSELGNESFTIVAGGVEISVTATLLCPIAQFAGNIPKSGTRLKIGAKSYVIGSLASDPTSVTFNLVAPDAH